MNNQSVNSFCGELCDLICRYRQYIQFAEIKLDLEQGYLGVIHGVRFGCSKRKYEVDIRTFDSIHNAEVFIESMSPFPGGIHIIDIDGLIKKSETKDITLEVLN